MPSSSGTLSSEAKRPRPDKAPEYEAFRSTAKCTHSSNVTSLAATSYRVHL